MWRRRVLTKVMFVTNEYPPDRIAGTAMSTQFLSEELASRGYRVSVVVNTRYSAPPRESNGNLDVYRLRPLNLPMTRMVQRAGLLLPIARQVRPHVIQGQSLSCGCLALIVGRILGIPTVTSIQGYDLYKAGPWARRTYIPWTLTHSTRVVTVSGDLQSRALTLSARLAEVIPNGVRTREAHKLDQETARLRLRLPAEAKIVLFVGRLTVVKGVAHLLRAMPHVLKRCPSAMLVLVGEGEEKRSLADMADRLGLTGRIFFAGSWSNDDVIGFMRASDLFVLPSLAEPFGIVLVEAMSCGLPIVASNVMGIPSIIEDGTNGFLVPPGDEGTLAERMIQLLTTPKEAAAMGHRNIQAAENYALSSIADRFVTLWEGAIISPAAPFHREGGSGAVG